MEISTPTKIIDGHSDIANISYTVVRGYGECAMVTTPSELFMYSVTGKERSRNVGVPFQFTGMPNERGVLGKGGLVRSFVIASRA